MKQMQQKLLLNGDVMEYMILLDDSEGNRGWYMNGYLVAARNTQQEENVCKRPIIGVHNERSTPTLGYALGVNVDSNQWTYPWYVDLTVWVQNKINRFSNWVAPVANSVTGY
jgi:hypothetical protein